MPTLYRYSLHHPENRQRGAATLFFSVIILLVTTLTVFVASRSTITEQRLAANEVRTRIAFEHAQAGLDYAAMRFANPAFNDDEIFDIAQQGVAETSIQSAFLNDSITEKYREKIGDPVDPPIRIAFCVDPPLKGPDFECPDQPGPITNCTPPSGSSLIRPLAVSCGWSDDNSARHMVMQRLSGSAALPSLSVTNPVTTPASVDMSGSFTVVNYFNNLTYWAGGKLDFKNATAKSFVRQPGSVPKDYSKESATADIYKSYQLADALGDQCVVIKTGQDHFYNDKCKAPTNKATDHLKPSTGKDEGIGVDVIEVDTDLKNLSEDDFFRQFFGLKKESDHDEKGYKDLIASTVLSPADAIKVLPSLFGKVIWVDGDFKLAGGRLGSLDRPVVLIVEGNVDLGANLEFYGILYVSGSIGGSSNGNIYGAVLTYKGMEKMTGNPTIFYDETVMANSRNLGRKTVMPGTWRDWAAE